MIKKGCFDIGNFNNFRHILWPVFRTERLRGLKIEIN